MNGVVKKNRIGGGEMVFLHHINQMSTRNRRVSIVEWI